MGLGLFLKRFLDIAISLMGLILLSPILLLMALSVYITMGRPIIFAQKRPGYLGKPFYMYKFRTMTNKCDSKGSLLPDARRLTRLGVFYRKTSLDELPELLNVLKGEMSLVGPRPLLMQYLIRYTTEQSRRHNVKPGITGLAQVNGRNSLSWEEKFSFDTQYVDNWSIWLDLRILFHTVIMVVARKGISAEGEATMPEFLGSTQHSPSLPGVADKGLEQAAASQDRQTIV